MPWKINPSIDNFPPKSPPIPKKGVFEEGGVQDREGGDAGPKGGEGGGLENRVGGSSVQPTKGKVPKLNEPFTYFSNIGDRRT